MKITELIQLLQQAHIQYGDVDMVLRDRETGYWKPVQEVLKLHPYTGKYGTMNRDKPVNAIGMVYGTGHASDLVLRNI